MPEISIIVPVYKVEKYLDRCIKSILNQTFTDFELILVDDGSPDNCPMMCDEWAKKDPRIKVIHKENGGLSSARNAGLEIAIGNYIGFVDSDDWIATDMYELLHELIIKYDADMACGDIKKVVFEENNLIRKKSNIKIYTQEEFALKYFKIGSNETVHYVVNKLYKSVVAKNIKFPEGLINEDVEGFFYALVECKKIVTISKIIYYYWQNPNGISNTWFSYKQMDLLKVWKHVWECCESMCNSQWEAFAKINFLRAHFGLLCRLILNNPEEDNKFRKEETYLLGFIKEHYQILMKTKMPITRKIMLICICIDYDKTKWLFRIVKFRRWKI